MKIPLHSMVVVVTKRKAAPSCVSRTLSNKCTGCQRATPKNIFFKRFQKWCEDFIFVPVLCVLFSTSHLFAARMHSSSRCVHTFISKKGTLAQHERMKDIEWKVPAYCF